MDSAETSDSILTPLTIVDIYGQLGYGVVLARVDAHEYRVRPVGDLGAGGLWEAGLDGLYDRSQLTEVRFCENDYLPGLILATAAGYSHRYGNRQSLCTGR